MCATTIAVSLSPEQLADSPRLRGRIASDEAALIVGQFKQYYRPGTIREKLFNRGPKLPDEQPGGLVRKQRVRQLEPAQSYV